MIRIVAGMVEDAQTVITIGEILNTTDPKALILQKNAFALPVVRSFYLISEQDHIVLRFVGPKEVINLRVR